MITEPTITDLAKYTDCRYSLVVATARRARQIVSGAEPLIDTAENKPVSIAVREINRGKVAMVSREEEPNAQR